MLKNKKGINRKRIMKKLLECHIDKIRYVLAVAVVEVVGGAKLKTLQ